MRRFLDTSVLVAAFVHAHAHHEPSLRILTELTPESGGVSCHSLAETYSVLTRLPVRPVILPEQALLYISDVVSRLQPVALDLPGYLSALNDAAALGVRGGTIYDALLLRCARGFGAETIYTWNVAHFRRVAPDLAEIIRTP